MNAIVRRFCLCFLALFAGLLAGCHANRPSPSATDAPRLKTAHYAEFSEDLTAGGKVFSAPTNIMIGVLQFDADGKLINLLEFQRLVAEIRRANLAGPAIARVAVVSLGWNHDFSDSQKSYSVFFKDYFTQLIATGKFDISGRWLVLCVSWPSGKNMVSQAFKSVLPSRTVAKFVGLPLDTTALLTSVWATANLADTIGQGELSDALQFMMERGWDDPREAKFKSGAPCFRGCDVTDPKLLADRLAGSPEFAVRDITDVASLAKKLVDETDPAARYLHEQMDDGAKAILQEYVANGTNIKSLESCLPEQLNRLVTGPYLAALPAFQNVPLSFRTNDLAGGLSVGGELAELNRMTLEGAFRGELSRAHKSDPCSMYLATNMDDAIIGRLRSLHLLTNASPSQLGTILAEGLNQALTSNSLWRVGAFTNVLRRSITAELTLAPDVTNNCDHNLEMRLNRLLLEDAYRLELTGDGRERPSIFLVGHSFGTRILSGALGLNPVRLPPLQLFGKERFPAGFDPASMAFYNFRRSISGALYIEPAMSRAEIENIQSTPSFKGFPVYVTQSRHDHLNGAIYPLANIPYNLSSGSQGSKIHDAIVSALPDAVSSAPQPGKLRLVTDAIVDFYKSVVFLAETPVYSASVLPFSLASAVHEHLQTNLSVWPDSLAQIPLLEIPVESIREQSGVHSKGLLDTGEFLEAGSRIGVKGRIHRIADVLQTFKTNSHASFWPEDIIDPQAVARRLASADGGFQGGEFKQIQAACQPPNGDTNVLREKLTVAFNEMIAGRSLVDKAPFNTIKLRLATIELRDQLKAARQNAETVSRDEVSRLNRMLLEDSFPGELSWNFMHRLRRGEAAERAPLYVDCSEVINRPIFSENLPYQPGLPLFTSGGITNLPSLVQRLSQASNATNDLPAYFLKQQLDAEEIAALAKYTATKGGNPLQLQHLLLNRLNALVTGPPLPAKPFQHLPPEPEMTAREMEELLKADPDGKELMVRNRKLLEKAFPRELSRNTPSFPWANYTIGWLDPLGSHLDYNRWEIFEMIYYVLRN